MLFSLSALGFLTNSPNYTGNCNFVCVSLCSEKRVQDLACGSHYRVDLGLSAMHLISEFTHTFSHDASCQEDGIW